MLANKVRGLPVFHIDESAAGSPYGDGNWEHPIKRLRELGASHVSEERIISSLYWIRHISNDQCARVGRRKIRANDVLAYPFFIEAG
jgi:hypothetical protein